MSYARVYVTGCGFERDVLVGHHSKLQLTKSLIAIHLPRSRSLTEWW